MLDILDTTSMRHKISDNERYDFCIVYVGNNNKNNLHNFSEFKHKIINVKEEKLIFSAIRNLNYKFLICLDDKCSIIPIFINMMVKDHSSNSLVCIMSTQFRDGIVYPTKDNKLYKDGRINIMMTQNIVKMNGFSDVFFDEVIKRGSTLKCLTVTSSIIGNED